MVPTLTLGWRLKMALDATDTSAQSMADQLGVSRATVSRWMNDKGAPPRRAYVSQWAAVTGVDADWLARGKAYSGADTLPYVNLVFSAERWRALAAESGVHE